MTQCPHSLADGRGMMRKIIDHRNASAGATKFQAALHAFEGIERRLNLRWGQTVMLSAGDHGQGISHVKFPTERDFIGSSSNFELRRRFNKMQIFGTDVVAWV